ncbi:Putative Ca2+/H+ antiporter, TMEM165/GDT1 family [Modicisalibacter muralis]|uniref:GDT1 family protein n=1 Tax=Modicisalibacter muralis TaxID=119000 RepID=A0A1G9FKF3_9GAMM|nr:TMEM165/GDT1 family protein [Halomonas muralis]SDK88860.1 Putative Ca2+/H+ antiporter, TMEM165/GDT1 family [Halomonas muralis]
MDALLTSILAVGLAEIGDKTQLLTLLLVARYRRPWPILTAICGATLINHGVSAWLGAELITLIDERLMSLLLGAAFVGVGLWLLKPDGEETLEAGPPGRGVFFTAFVLFFLAEIGDKTQIATLLLGAQFADVLAVTVGTTLGMLAANAPVLWLGQRFCQRLPVRWIQRLASLIFIMLGIWALLFEAHALSGW